VGRLGGQFLAGGSHLLGGGAVGLDYLVKLLDGPGVFINAPGLFVAGRVDLMDQFRGFLDLRHDIVDELACVGCGFHAGSGNALDLLGRDLTAFRELAHLGGHHGKALAVLSGPGRFDGGVQGQQIGLPGNLLDEFDLGGDKLHGRHRFTHRLAAFHGIGSRLGGNSRGLPGVIGGLGHGAGQFLHGGRNLLHRGGLFAGPLGDLLGAAAQLLTAGGDLIRRATHIGDDLLELLDHILQCLYQFILIAAFFHLDQQVTPGNFPGCAGNLV